MSSMSEIARAKVEAAAAGEEYVPPEATEKETVEVAPEEPVAAPTDPVEEVEEAEEAEAEAAADAAEAALPEDATDEEIAAAREAAEQEFYAGTYKTKEEAERGIAEKDATIQRLFAERDQALREAEARRVAQEQADQAEEIDLPAWDAWAAAQVEAGAGAAGAEQALTNGGYDGYQLYLRHWMASDDPSVRAEAVLYNNEVVMQIAEVRADAAAQRRAATPSAAEAKQQAAAMVLQKRPDFNDYQEQMAAAIAGMNEWDVQFLKNLAATGVDGQAKALELLYLEAKSQAPAPSTKQKAKEIEGARRKASADAATLAATTPTPEGAPQRTPPPAAEAEGLRRKQGLRARQNLDPLDE